MSSKPLSPGAVECWLESLAVRHGDREALIGQDLSTRWTFRQLADRVKALRSQLEAKDIGRGDAILVALPDGPEALEALLAVASTAVAVPIPAQETAAFYRSLLQQLRVRAIMMKHRPSAPLTLEARAMGTPLLLVPSSRGGTFGFDGSFERRTKSGVPEDLALISCTSGTSGRLKLVGQTGADLIDAVSEHARWLDFREDDRALCMMPFAHLHSLWRSSLPVMFAGGTVCGTGGFQLPLAAQWFDAFAPTYVSMVPAFYRQLLSWCRENDWRPRGLKLAGIGSDRIEPGLCEEITKTLGCETVQFYGLSEVCPFVAMNLRGEGGQKAMKIHPRWEVKIDGGGTQGLPDGESGEILIRGGTFHPLVAGNPPNVSSDGFLRTGDLGIRSATGRLIISGRMDDRITRGGQKIFPEEIEQAVLLLDGVQEVAVFAVPDPVLGEKSALVVKTARVTAEDIRRHCETRLRSWMVPDFIFVEAGDLPRTASGKISRKQLAEHYGDRCRGMENPPEQPREAVSRDLLEKVTAVFAKALGRQPQADEDYFKSGGNSLSAVEVLIVLESEFGVAIPPAVFSRSASPAAVASYISAQTAPGAPDKAGRCTIIQRRNTGIAVCIAPGLGGSVTFGHSGQTKLKTRHSLAVVQGHTDPDQPGPWNSWEEFAEEVIPDVLEVLPNQKLVFVGFSLGAHVALHLARAALVRGVEVPAVVVLDDDAELDRRAPAIARRRPESGGATYNAWLLAATPAAPVRTHIIYFRAEQNAAWYRGDPTSGWGEVFSGSVLTADIEGSHGGVAEAGGMRLVGEQFDDLLDRAYVLPRPGNPSAQVMSRFEARKAERSGDTGREFEIYGQLAGTDDRQPVWALRTLAEICAEKGNHKEAERWFRQALSSCPWPLETLVRCIEFLQGEGRRFALREAGSMIASLEVDHPSAAHQVGRFYLKAGKPLRAARWFRRGLAMCPGHVLCDRDHVSAVGRGMRIKPLIRRAEKLLARRPGMLLSFGLLQARALLWIGQPSAALSVLQYTSWLSGLKTPASERLRARLLAASARQRS
jgi:acyl-CoA synthetase (AMP-forming)/AMP-acid ligase II/acyl carrier protein/pimeloyl-ACP methyl ester carboxylesterase